VAGALTADELKAILRKAGFRKVRVTIRPESRVFIKDWAPGLGIEDYIASAFIEGFKPDRG